MIGSKFSIGRLRVSGPQETGPAVRLRLAHQLNTADLHPTGLPPPAILVVRRMNDPLPGRIVSTRPVVRVDTAWETACRRSLEKSYRKAARPRQGLILGEPEAVVFADEAEMLACLLLAKQRSLSPAAWWFRMIVNRLGSAETLVGQLMERPDLAPAVFGYLAAWHRAEDVLVKISSQQSCALLQAVIKQYQLPALLSPDPGISRNVNSRERSQEQKDLYPLPKEYRPPSDTPPPWANILTVEIPTNLDPERQAIFGLCLLLQIRPAVPRNPTFQREWQWWWQSVTDYSLEPDAQPGTSSFPAGTPDHPNEMHLEPGYAENSAYLAFEEHHLDDVKGAGKNPQLAGDAASLQPDVEHRPSEFKSAPSATPAVVTPLKESKDVEKNKHRTHLGKLHSSSDAPLTADAVPLRSEVDHWSSETKATPFADQLVVVPKTDLDAGLGPGVETAIGGVFYLTNLMHALNLPAACEPGWGLASQVSAWGVLELLGRALLGPAGVDYMSDPLWRVLSNLDGRLGETLPGEDYEIVGDGSLPTGWATMIDRSWSLEDCPLLTGINADLKRWLSLVAPFLSRRLQHVLHLQDFGDIPCILLRASGRIHVTRSHVDLVMDLDAISLRVRRAGLDANPGWLPIFGRIVTFHFR